ncbi:MAG: OmpA family protein [Syntrophaceae bacterium]|nr:OmpA family protein [Syntrophaceae bacterium]
MKSLMKIFVVAALLVFSTTAFAQIRPGAFNIGPYFGVGAFEGNQDLDNAPVIGIRGGYDFTKNWGVEATANWIPTRYDHNYYVPRAQGLPGWYNDDSHVNVYNYRIEGIYNFELTSIPKLVPFLAVGIGGQTIDYRGNTHGTAKDRTRFAPDWGGGLKYFLTDDLAVRADVRHVIAIGSIYNDIEATLGMAFYFGGKKEAPAPPPPEPAKQVFDERVRLNIEFDFDKADIRPRYHDELKTVGDFMNKYPDVNMAIEGHTDSIGTDEYNQRLSQRRVDSVKNYIVEKFNIDGKRIKATGYGESRPIADNSTDEGRQRNRRVEAVSIK